MAFLRHRRPPTHGPPTATARRPCSPPPSSSPSPAVLLSGWCRDQQPSRLPCGVDGLRPGIAPQGLLGGQCPPGSPAQATH